MNKPTEEKLTMADIKLGQLFVVPGVSGVMRKVHPCWGDPSPKGKPGSLPVRVVYPNETVGKLKPRKGG